MNHTDPKVLDLWVAWVSNENEASDKGPMMPAEQAFGNLFGKLKAENGNAKAATKLHHRNGQGSG